MIHRLFVFVFRSSVVTAITGLAALAQAEPANSCTFLGGSGSQEVAQALVVASNGDLIIAGKTDSPDLPGTIGGFDESYNGAGDAFVARFSSDGTQLFAATYFGGAFPDEAVFVYEAGDGSIWVGGTTSSADFPTTADAFSTHNDRQDAFVVSFNANLSAMQYGTTFGSPGCDYGEAFAVDDVNQLVYISGRTVLRTTALPVTPTAINSAIVGGSSLYLAVLDLSPPSSTLLAYGTFIGGSGDERAVGDLTLEGNGIVTISGRTNSTDFPVTAGAVQVTGGGSNQSGIIARIDTKASGAAGLMYSTYLGGSAGDTKIRHDIDAGGVLHVMLESTSTDLPVTANALIATAGLGSDIYYAQIDPDQGAVTSLLYGSWIVTAGSDLAADIAFSGGKVAMLMQVGGFGHFVTPGAFLPSAFSGGHGYILVLDVSSQPDPFVTYATHYAGCPIGGSSVRPAALLYDGSEVILAGGASLLPITHGAFQSQAASNLDAFVGRLELTTHSDAFTSFGTGCPGSLGTPQLAGSVPARICRNLELEASGLLPFGSALFIVGFDRTQFGGAPLPLSLAFMGASGCDLLVAPDRTFPRFADAVGNVVVSLPVPNRPSLLGLEVFSQCASVDPAANDLGVTLTNAIMTEVRW